MIRYASMLWIVLFASSLGAGEVTLAWDPSLSPDVTGYRLYFGPNTFAGLLPEDAIKLPTVRTVDVGNVLIFKLTNLSDGTYFFVATAYGVPVEGELPESLFSNEVSTTIVPIEFKITSLSVSMRWFGVVLLCTTSTQASAILRWTEINGTAGETVIATPTPTKTEHRAVLYLTMGQVRYYRYEWTVTDPAGATAVLGGTFQIR